MDTIVSSADRHCVVSLVERVTGCVLLGKLRSSFGRGDQSTGYPVDSPPPSSLQDRHRRQRHRVPRLSWDRGDHGHDLLFRHAVPLLGARHKRKHERPRAAVRPEAALDEAPHAGAMRRDALRLNNRPRKRHRYFSPIEVLALYTSW